MVLTADPFLAEGIALYWPGASDEYELVLDLESRRDGETPALPDMEHGTPDFFVPVREAVEHDPHRPADPRLRAHRRSRLSPPARRAECGFPSPVATW